jgi:hypothetical protein
MENGDKSVEHLDMAADMDSNRTHAVDDIH